ncbi:hypothetical protein ACEWY4_008229 [Coilia grayii]|uniref:Ribosomal RNA-processing protein 8 n=1 Tax=Coilia grayii TaxID=363190 RepID=A0ABD1KAH3_9TELE
MFAEEEWNDTISAETSTQCVSGDLHSVKENVTVRVGKKKSLLKTLQTLGSVPDWSTCSAPKDSDSETEAPTPHPKKKKKRNRKRKRDASENAQTEGGDSQDADIPKPIKKQKQTPQAKDAKKVNTAESVITEQGEAAVIDKESKNSMEKPLSRKQWRNRMKNKRRCKNKYQEKSLQTSDLNTTPSCKGKKGPDQNDTTRSQEETPEINNVQSKKSKKAKEKRKDKVANKGTSSLSPSKTDKAVSEEGLTNTSNTSEVELDKNPDKPTEKTESIIITKGELDKNLNKPLEKTEPLKPSDRRKQKEKQMRAEKLRQMLNSQRLEGQVKNKAEPAEKETEEDGDVTKNDVQTLDRSAALRSKMEKRLEAARFRYINEVLYTTSSSEAKKMFKQDPKAFEIYHLGFTTQVQHWPENPVDAIISFIRQKPSSLVVADFGCGDCKIARSVKNKVHSFDLAPTCDLVTVCDMAKVPLGDATVDIAVFCLSLMGTNLSDFLTEANRVLDMGGVLKIAEVASRFENVRGFVSALSSLGFKITSKDTKNNYFFLFEFVKVGEPSGNTKKTGLALKPCVYKKR